MSAPEWLVDQLAVMSGRRVEEDVKVIEKAATDRNLNFKYSRAACGFSSRAIRP